MSKDQTTQPTPRVIIGPATEPNPPWTGKYFVCVCKAEHQLCASDDLERSPILEGTRCSGCDYWLAPPCWTCGYVNIVVTPRFEHEHFLSEKSASSAVEFQPEGNPS
jgi:hypothetical protein